MSVFSVLFTLVLFSELSSRWVTTAMPTSKADDRVEDRLGLLLSDEPISEPASVMHRRSIELDSNIRDDNGSPQIIVLTVSDIVFPLYCIIILYDALVCYNHNHLK